MQTHELKTDPEVFDAVAAGLKTFEIRYDDRGYQVGDQLILRKTRYTGAEMSHILRGPCYGLADGWVIISLEP